MKRPLLLLSLLALAAAGCRKTTFTPDVVPASIQSYHQDSNGRLTLKIKCDSTTAKGRAILGSTELAKTKGKRIAAVIFQFYEKGHMPGKEQLTIDENGKTEYSVDIEKLNAALNGIPEQFRPADRILHVVINGTEVGQWDLESPAEGPHAESAEDEPYAETAEPAPRAESAEGGGGSGEAEPSPSVATPPAP